MRKSYKYPSVSIVIATYNSNRTIKKCLDAIKIQKYPVRKVEIIIVDGGSIDGTLITLKKYNVRIIKIPSKLQNAEYNKGVGIKSTKNEIILLLDHDNIMPHEKWLEHITNPFLNSKNIVASEPLRFQHDKSMSLLDRYFALLGGSDPVVYYLGKNSHLSWAFNKYNLLGEAKDRGSYYEVGYQKNKLPALGGNGAAIRREVLKKYFKASNKRFIHTDVMADILEEEKNKVALIKDGIVHMTDNNIFPFLKRRKYFVEKYYTQNRNRRYKIYDPNEDLIKLIKYVFITVTIIIPITFSIRGYIVKRDIAWFLHPLICISFLIIYGSIYIKLDKLRDDVFAK